MESVGVAVIIPTLDEACSIARVIAELPRPLVRSVIVADGGSRDGTRELAAAAGARVVVPTGSGYGRACCQGAAAAAAGILVFMDGDGADRGDLLAELVEPIANDRYDFVIASRTRGRAEPGAMQWHQRLAGLLAGRLIGALYGFRYSDMCAFRAIRQDMLQRLDMQEMTYGWNIEMQIKAARRGLRILELPMPYRRRLGGKSKVAGSLPGTLRAGTRILATLLRMMTQPQPSASGRHRQGDGSSAR
jgi:glycosyltransferase involved in cell wall biosynthesis